jgi:hypothetical protein
LLVKNWLSDPRAGCSSPSSLKELIEVDDVLEQFEGKFERRELLDF